MLSKKLTLSLLSLALLAPFADASNSQLEQIPTQAITVEPNQVPAAINIPQQTRWERFVYKVAPLDKYILPISGYAGAGAAVLALGLSLRDKATVKQALINTAKVGLTTMAVTFNGLLWSYFCITESLD